MRRLLGIAVVLAVAAMSGTALAHGELVDARPAPGAAVGGDVVEVELQFEEALERHGLTVTVEGPDGAGVATEDPKIVADVIVRVGIAQLVLPGSYRIAYRVPSADGFIFEGAYLFTYEPAARPVEPFPEGRASAGLTILLAAAGTVLFAGGGWLLTRRQAKKVAGG